ncbi:MAG: cytochrome c [Thermodesulfobacteriota bacterium]
MKTWMKMPLAIAAICFIGSAAQAQFAGPKDAVSYRKAVMHLIGVHFTRMGAMVKGEVPFEKADFSKNASVFKMLSELPWEAFMKDGSDKGDTSMKSSALKEKEKFNASAESFKGQVKKLGDAADAGDMNAIKPLFGETAGTCKACHMSFRKLF